MNLINKLSVRNLTIRYEDDFLIENLNIEVKLMSGKKKKVKCSEKKNKNIYK